MMRVGEGDSITWMELLPIVLASAVWGPAWRGQRIIVHCDNTGAVTIVNSGYIIIIIIRLWTMYNQKIES